MATYGNVKRELKSYIAFKKHPTPSVKYTNKPYTIIEQGQKEFLFKDEDIDQPVNELRLTTLEHDKGMVRSITDYIKEKFGVEPEVNYGLIDEDGWVVAYPVDMDELEPDQKAAIMI